MSLSPFDRRVSTTEGLSPRAGLGYPALRHQSIILERDRTSVVKGGLHVRRPQTLFSSLLRRLGTPACALGSRPIPVTAQGTGASALTVNLVKNNASVAEAHS
jgi:hypothetical protein